MSNYNPSLNNQISLKKALSMESVREVKEVCKTVGGKAQLMLFDVDHNLIGFRIMPKKIEGLKKYFVLLNEKDFEQAKRTAVKRDIRNLSIVGNTSGFIRYLVQHFIKGE